MAEAETLFDLLEAQALVRPDHPALVDGRASLNYGRLRDRAVWLGNGLGDAGVKRGDRVLLLLPLGLDFFVTFLALMRMGAAVVLLDPAMDLKILRACVAGVRPHVLIGSAKAQLFRLLPELGAIPLALSLEGLLARRIKPRRGETAAGAQPQDPALVTFTSGSTGRPKTIVRSHAFLLRQHAAVQASIEARRDDRELSTLPTFILSNLGAGITSILPLKFYARPDRMNAHKMVRHMRHHGVNRLLAAPALCRVLCDEVLRRGAPLSGVKRIFTGGGPIFPNLLSDLKTAFPQARILMVYGSSEAEPIAHLSDEELSGEDLAMTTAGGGLLAGRPVQAVDLAIVQDHPGVLPAMDWAAFETLTMPPGQIGEIVVSGDHVVTGYLNPDDVTTKFRVGNRTWHRTGDAGYLDDFGRLWLMGRCAARIDDIYPFAIEAAAMSRSDLRRVAVVSHAGRMTLVVEAPRPLAPEVEQQLIRLCPAIEAIRYLDRIPVDRRHHSKVLYRDLARKL